MASSHDQDSDCGGDQGSLRPPKSLPKCLPQAQFMAVQGIGRGRGILEQVNELYITRQVTRATHVRNRICPRVELILKIIIILLIIFLGFIKSNPC